MSFLHTYTHKVIKKKLKTKKLLITIIYFFLVKSNIEQFDTKIKNITGLQFFYCSFF